MKKILKQLCKQGVIFIDINSVYIDQSVIIEKGAIIYPNNYIYGNSLIKKNAVLKPNNIIYDSEIGEKTEIVNSIIKNSVIGTQCEIGPFAYLRPNSKIGDNCKIGDFVEVKNSLIGNKTKASHLSYIGDAEVGENCNIGCGSIFVNYNGKEKNKTVVENNCFIGSNCNLIAPINLKKNTYVACGTTVIENSNENDFIIGRVIPTVKPERAKKYLKEVK